MGAKKKHTPETIVKILRDMEIEQGKGLKRKRLIAIDVITNFIRHYLNKLHQYKQGAIINLFFYN